MDSKIAFIINSTKSYNVFTTEIFDTFENFDEFDFSLFYTKKPKHAVDLAEECVHVGFNIIIAVGGDGTCNEVINGIMRSGKSKEIMFGIVPNGTGNDFSKALGQFNVEQFLFNLARKKTKKIDLIHITSAHQSEYGLNIAGIGLDGQVVHLMNTLRTKYNILGRKITYSLSIFFTFLTYKKTWMRIQYDNTSYSGQILMTIVCNGTTFGNGLIVSPDARIDDSMLNVTIFGNLSYWDYLKNLNKIKKGIKIVHPEVHYLETEKIIFDTIDQPQFAQVDGESLGQSDIKISIVKQAINLLCVN